MPRPVDTRKRFKAALAFAGMTAKQFAEERGITPSHLHQVVRGERDSVPLNAAIEAFIAKHMRQTVAA